MLKKITIQIFLFLLLVGPTLALTIFGYIKTEEALTSVVTLRRESIASVSALIIKERLDQIVDVGTSFSSVAQFQQLIDQGKWKEAVATLQNVPSNFPVIERLSLIDKAGVLRADFPHLVPDVVGRSFIERDWYQGVSKNWQPFISDVYKRTTEPRYNVVAVAVPIKEKLSAGTKDKILGILVFQVKLDIFLEWAKEINTGGNGFIYITNQRGNVISYLRFDQQEDTVDFSSTPVVQKALEGLQGVEISYNPVDKEKLVSSSAPILGHGWTVVVVNPIWSAFRERDSVLQNIMIVYFILNLFTMFFAYWILRNRANVEKANQQLRESDHQKSEFISIASHQLRTPLGSMRWNLELLESDIKSLPEATRERLHETYKSNLHVIELVSDLLNIARIEQGRTKEEPKLTNIVTIIQNSITELKPEVERRSVTLEMKIKKNDIPEIIIDPKHFREVIQNLLSNAVTYTRKGGSVKVEVDSTNDSIEIQVSDSGIGIPEKDRSRIFTKFGRAENAAKVDTEGSGLGLYIVKSFVEGWGGKIYFESEENKGTTFYVSLPLVPKIAETGDINKKKEK